MEKTWGFGDQNCYQALLPVATGGPDASKVQNKTQVLSTLTNTTLL